VKEKRRPKILIVDDDKNICKMIEASLRKERKYDIDTALSGEACLKLIKEELPDLCLVDIQMPGIDGIETLKRIKEEDTRLPVIMMTAHGTIERAVNSMKLGAYDFLTKPFARDRLLVTVQNALINSSLQKEVSELRSELKNKYTFSNIVGQSGVMQDVFRAVEKVVDSNVTVLIQGESGTGKELIARAIHYHSKLRTNKPFIESLLESELFGHEKGSFTGAAGRRIGKFEQADNGTIFLDEIGLMTPATQSKILRILQEREFERVGGNELIKVNVRVISATNKDLEEEMKNGTFREDLYYRISVFPIKLPALRERKEDIPLLAAHFLKKCNEQEGKEVEGISSDALDLLMAYNWPGNVRELENAMERAVVLANGYEITAKDLPPAVRSLGEKRIYESDNTLASWIEKLEEQALRQALLECEGNISKTAKQLGIGRATIYRKAKKYGLPMVKTN